MMVLLLFFVVKPKTLSTELPVQRNNRETSRKRNNNENNNNSSSYINNQKNCSRKFHIYFLFCFYFETEFRSLFCVKVSTYFSLVLPSFHSSTIKLSNHLMLQKLKEETVEIAIFNLRQPQMLSQVIAKKLSYRPHLQ